MENDKHSRYNRSEKGRARDLRYKRKHWQRVETSHLSYSAKRRERNINATMAS